MTRVRTGAYRKSFFTSQDWLPHADALWPRFQADRNLFAQGLISPAELTARVLLEIWRHMRPRDWHSGRRPSDTRSAVAGSPALETLQSTRLRGIPPEATDVLLDWHTGFLPLDLFFEIPTSHRVLEAQTRGRRCVSLLIRDREQFLLGGEDRDSFSFALHDLIHASHFYRDPEHFARQVFFARWMRVFTGCTRTQDHLQRDPDFGSALDYLIADMNTHWVHSTKCLKSILRGQGALQAAALDSLARVTDPLQAEEFCRSWNLLNSPVEDETVRSQADAILQSCLRSHTGVPALHSILPYKEDFLCQTPALTSAAPICAEK